MAKYVMDKGGTVYENNGPSAHSEHSPVIVIPEADWKRLVERYFELPGQDGVIDDIIDKTEADNA